MAGASRQFVRDEPLAWLSAGSVQGCPRNDYYIAYYFLFEYEKG